MSSAALATRLERRLVMCSTASTRVKVQSTRVKVQSTRVKVQSTRVKVQSTLVNPGQAQLTRVDWLRRVAFRGIHPSTKKSRGSLHRLAVLTDRGVHPGQSKLFRVHGGSTAAGLLSAMLPCAFFFFPRTWACYFISICGSVAPLCRRVCLERELGVDRPPIGVVYSPENWRNHYGASP